MKYTVLLLRPDYVASNFGQDTYLAWVEADDVATAQTLAQREAYRSDVPLGDDESANHSDYYVLFVAEGHVDNLAVEV